MQSKERRVAMSHSSRRLAFGDRDLALVLGSAVDRFRRVSSRRYVHTSQG